MTLAPAKDADWAPFLSSTLQQITNRFALNEITEEHKGLKVSYEQAIKCIRDTVKLILRKLDDADRWDIIAELDGYNQSYFKDFLVQMMKVF